jgi:hypothetical protein
MQSTNCAGQRLGYEGLDARVYHVHTSLVTIEASSFRQEHSPNIIMYILSPLAVFLCTVSKTVFYEYRVIFMVHLAAGTLTSMD